MKATINSSWKTRRKSLQRVNKAIYWFFLLFTKNVQKPDWFQKKIRQCCRIFSTSICDAFIEYQYFRTIQSWIFELERYHAFRESFASCCIQQLAKVQMINLLWHPTIAIHVNLADHLRFRPVTFCYGTKNHGTRDMPKFYRVLFWL